MQIPEYNRRVGATGFRKPVSTLESEKHLVKAREHQRTAQNISLIGGLAQDTLGVVDNILAVKSATDLMAAETEMAKRESEFFLKLNDPANPIPFDEWESMTNDELASIKADEEEKLPLRRSKEEFGRRFDRWEVDFRDRLQVQLRIRTAGEADSKFRNSYSAAIDDGNYKKVKEYVEGVRGWLLTSAEADQKLLEAETTIAYNIASAEIDGFDDIEQGIKHLYSKDLNESLKAKGIDRPEVLTPAIRKAMEKTKREDWRFKQTLETERFQNANMEQMEEAQKLTYTGKITSTMIDSGEFDRLYPDVTAEQKRILRGIIEQRGKESTTKAPQTAPEFEVELGIRFADENVSNWELNQLVESWLTPDEQGRLMTYDDYQSFLTDLKTRRPEPAVIGGYKMFEASRQKENITFSEEAELQNMLNAERLKKDYSPDEILGIAENLLEWMEKPNKLKRIKNDIDNAAEGKPRAEKKIEKLGEEGELLGIEQTGVELPEEEPEKPTEEPIGYQEYMKLTGKQPVKQGVDKEGNAVFFDGETRYRYNVKKDRLEYYDADKGKWRKTKKQ